MTAQELIKKYELYKAWKNVDGKPVAGVGSHYRLTKEEAAEVIAKKQEIMAIFDADEAARKKAMEEHQAKVDAIEGLSEITAAERDLEKWHDEFNASFEGDCGGLGVRPYPKYDIKAMKEKYPRAAAYLKAEEYAHKNNWELAKIGRKALNEVIDGDYIKAMADMQAALGAFAERHIWD